MVVRVIAVKALLLITIVLSAFGGVFADNIDRQDLQNLDDEYQQLLGEIYRAAGVNAGQIADVETLWTEYRDLLSAGQSVRAHALLVSNIGLFATQAGNPAIVFIVEKLLEGNQRQLAETIYARLEQAGGAGLPYLDFQFAKYYARQRDWIRVNHLLGEVPIDLKKEDAEYAYLLQGISRQFLKQHRLSIESYESIVETSPYYIHARLNAALANLRQGWTIEARAIITGLIPVSRSRNQTELTNRMFVVLGYALLQQEYYRDARDAFRKVDSDSDYVARALFGIALAAVSQGDLTAALNAVSLLKGREGNDLSRDEAFLLLPYIYQRLDQPLQIENSFSDAIDHFETRLAQLQLLNPRPFELRLQASGKLVVGNQSLDYQRLYPTYLLTNNRGLNQLSSEVTESDTLARIEILKAKYDRAINDIVSTLIDDQIRIINSYLSQARYGLARHYDNQNGDSQ